MSISDDGNFDEEFNVAPPTYRRKRNRTFCYARLLQSWDSISKVNPIYWLLITILIFQVAFAIVVGKTYNSDAVQEFIPMATKTLHQLGSELSQLNQLSDVIIQLNETISGLDEFGSVSAFFVTNFDRFNQLLSFSNELEICIKHSGICLNIH